MWLFIALLCSLSKPTFYRVTANFPNSTSSLTKKKKWPLWLVFRKIYSIIYGLYILCLAGENTQQKLVDNVDFRHRYLWRIPTVWRHWNDSEWFPHYRSGQHHKGGVPPTVLGNLRLDMQRVPVQQSPAELYIVRLHWRVGDNCWSVIQQLNWTRILSTKTLCRSDIVFVRFPRW